MKNPKMRRPMPAKRATKPRGATPIVDTADVQGSEGEPSIRRGIQSVEIGFRVLAALATHMQPSTLGSVATRAGLSASQTHRYLSSLIASGMARQVTATGRYDLGSKAIQVGLAALARTDIFAEADPAIAEFTRETGRTTLVAALGPHGPTIVRWHAGRVPVITSLAVGSTLPLLGSATGHAFLTFMGAEELAGAIDRHESANGHDDSIDVDAIRRHVRATMHASVEEILIPGLRAAAVPILDLQGRAALVATALATPAFSRKDDASIIERLKTVCGSLTAKLGAA